MTDKKTTFEEILPKQAKPSNDFYDYSDEVNKIIDACIESLKQAESEGLVALNPPSEEELFQIICKTESGIDHMTYKSVAQLVAAALHQRIERGR